ncbi:MAG: DNA repair protein RecN, partial [Eubacteriales bacterium]|nr:DNA repair protein RecN [Eubacteriales bacterium]
MLETLHIENIAVIEKADISFADGLNVLTGETGAGKSIVIDALDAVLGGRVSRTLVRTGADRAVVSAVFSSDTVQAWFDENDIDYDDADELILQRRVSAEGKSSCRVNGIPVTAGQLRELGALLLDIHGQNDGRQLMDESRHREYLDRFGVDRALLSEYTSVYDAWRSVVREMDELRLNDSEKERLSAELKARIDDLERADIHPGEEEELRSRRDLLRNAEKLTEAIDEAYSALYDGEENAVSLCADAEEYTGRAAAWHSDLLEAQTLLRDAGFAMQDAAERLRDVRASLDFSPEEYDALESRLDQLRRLEKRYCTDESGLARLLEESQIRLDELEYAGDRLEKLERDLKTRRDEVLSAAKRLTKARMAAATELEQRVTSELTALSMPSARFGVVCTPLAGESGFDVHGGDEIRFVLAANAGEMPGPISRIASGGELSRIMLALKNVFAERDNVPSLVFDEIDTGVSGIAAQRVGEKLAELAGVKQILCVTHLPQIAAMADTHFSVEKAEKNGRTFTAVRELDKDGRLRELARLHG